LLQYDKDAFDCIVLDEAHHVTADTYQKIMKHFTPKLWLGMTATPDKRDDNVACRNVYELFNHQIAYEICLQQTMEENLLCPFHYFGITDLSIVGDDKDNRNFSMLTSDERVKHIIQQANYYGYSGEKVKGLIFCSSIKETQELSHKFNNIVNPDTGGFYRTIALNGDANEQERQDAFERLAMNESEANVHKQPLDYIFSVEILNEGWEFPGGKIEAGETPQEALKREIMEELDTEIKVGALIDTIEYDYPNFHLSMGCFWCEILSGDLVLKEHENAKWLPKEHIGEVEWLPADVTLIEKIREDM
jgi:mutator protein MutT